MNRYNGYDRKQCLTRCALGWVLGMASVTLGCGDDGDSNDDSAAGTSQSASSGGAAACPTAAAPAPAPAPTAAALPAGTISVCPRPESAYFDSTSDAWYVSCQAAPDVPNDGYVAKLNSDATAIVTEKFVTGLDEPKGIRVRNGKLYVSNVDELVVADVATGNKLATTTVLGIDPQVPTMNNSMNDVTVDDVTGTVYVSDQRNDILYSFDENGGSAKLLVRNANLQGPNGVLVDRRDPAAPRLLVASLGPGLNPMIGTTTKLGAVYSIDLADLNDGDGAVEVTYISQRIGNLDGMEFYGDDLIVSDFFAGRVMRFTPTDAVPTFDQNDAQIVRQSFKNSADLGIDPARNMLVVPETSGGTVVVINLGS